MAISQHRRKTGATTITQDGKIVGNIGKGKTHTPTVHNVSAHTLEPKEGTAGEKSPIAARSEKFKTLTVADENSNFRTADANTVQVLWNLSEGHPIMERLNVLSHVIDDIPFGEQKTFMENLMFTKDEHDQLAAHAERELVSENDDGDDDNMLTKNMVNLLAYTKGNVSIKRYLCSNEKMLPETLAYLSCDESTFVRNAVAATAKTPPEVLAKLGRERNNSIRRRIAKNPNTPHETLQRYIELNSTEIQEMVALNPAITPDMCRTLAKDYYINIKMNLIANDATPTDVLEYFVNHPDPGIDYDRVRFSAERALEKRWEAHHGNI